MSTMTMDRKTLLSLAVVSDVPSDDTEVKYATAPSIRAGRYIYTNRSKSWPDFVKDLHRAATRAVTDKDAAGVFIGAPLVGEPGPNGLLARTKADAGVHTMVTLDVDGVDKHTDKVLPGVQSIHAALGALMALGIDAAAYTTWSDDGKGYRYRIVVPVTASPDAERDDDGYALLVQYLMMVAQGSDAMTDVTTAQDYRAMYYPCTKKTTDGRIIEPVIIRIADDPDARDGVLDAAKTIQRIRQHGTLGNVTVTSRKVSAPTRSARGRHWVYHTVAGHCPTLHEEFNRLYRPDEAIAAFMSDLYTVTTPYDDDANAGRALWADSTSGEPGLIFTDHVMTSEHAADLQGTYDAYDFVSLHLYKGMSDSDRDRAMRDLLADAQPDVVDLYDDRGVLKQAKEDGRVSDVSGDLWYTLDKTGKPSHVIVDRLAGVICARHHIITDRGTDAVYVYDESRGIWRVNNLGAIKAWIRDMIVTVDDRMYTPKLADDVLKTVKIRSYAARFEPDPDYIVLADGVYHVPTGVFTPGFRYDIQALSCKDFAYGSDTDTCPIFDELLQVCVPEYARLLLEQWIGYSLTYDYRWQQMVWIYGPGGTGKSTIMAIMDGLLGSSASHVALEDMQDLRSPKLVDLLGKTANLAADSRRMTLDDAPVLKTLTGGDTIQVRQVYSAAITMKNLAKLTFGTNHLPDFRDSSGGLARRIRIIDMSYRIDAETDPALIERNIRLMDAAHDRSRMASEYPAIFRRCIRAYSDAVSIGHLDDNTSLKGLVDLYERDNDPVRMWWESTYEIVPDAEGTQDIPIAKLKTSYNAWAADEIQRPITSPKLRAELQQIVGDAVRLTSRHQWVVYDVRRRLRAADTIGQGHPMIRP